MFTRADN